MNNKEYFGPDSRRWDSRWVSFGMPHRFYSIGVLKTNITEEQTQTLEDCLILNPIYPRRKRKFREKFLRILSSKEISVIGSEFHQDENAGMAYLSEAFKFEDVESVKEFGRVLDAIQWKLKGMDVGIYLWSWN